MATKAILDLKTMLPLVHRSMRIPQYGFGTYQLVGQQCKNMVLAALKEGIRYIDTATFYGNEKEVGAAIRESGIPREEVFVVTKLWPDSHGYDKALKACEKSLQQLDIGYIDLYLIHWPGVNGLPSNSPKIATLRAESWKALEHLYNQGNCKSIGVSNYAIKHLEELLKSCSVPPSLNQVEFHPFLYQKELLAYCQSHNIVLGAYSSFAKGQILNDKTIVKISQNLKRTPAQILLRWALQHNTVVIPKCASKERLKENMNVFDFELSLQQMEELNALNKNWHCTWDPATIS